MVLRSTGLALLAIVLLPSCASLPAPLQMMFQPAEQVRHSGNDVASSYYRLGRYHQDHGDLTLALTAYTYAIARDPRAPGPRIAAAVIHAQQGRLPQARAMLLAVCAEYPDLVQPRNNLGYVYYLQGEYAAAAATFREALALQPANERARNNLVLAEGAGIRGAAAPPALARATPPEAPIEAATPAPQPSAAPVAASGMQLVRIAPNIYELKAAPAERTARAEPAPAQPAPAAAANKPRRAFALEIANGNGVTGMAKRFGQALSRRGIPASRITNAKPFGRAATSIEFRPGFETEARRLQAALGGKALLQPEQKLPPSADLRLVLGKDADLALASGPGETLLTAAASNQPINQ